MANPVGIPEDCTCAGPSRGLPCGCCAPAAVPTPRRIDNKAGLPAIRYRVGTYPQFRQAMLDGILRKGELAEWTSRRDDDWGIAVLDMWAYVADVLTFYQERIANEAYLRTATQRGSVMRLAALIDYRLGAGKAATAHLAFTVEKGKRVQIPAGLRIQSVPGQNEKPQKFEVEEPVLADAMLNSVRIHGVPVPQVKLLAGRTDNVLSPMSPPRIAPGEKLIVLAAVGPAVEIKEVVSVTPSDSGPIMRWTPALRVSGSTAHRLLSSHPLLGPSVPPYTFDPRFTIIPPPPPATTPVTPIGYAATSYSQPTNGPIVLDGVHRNIAVGSRFVFVYAAAVPGRRTGIVTDVSFSTQDFGGFAVPVTKVSVTYDSGGALPDIDLGYARASMFHVVEPALALADTIYPETPTAISAQGPIAVPLAPLQPTPSATPTGGVTVPLTPEAPTPRDLLAPGRTIVLDDKEGRPSVVTILSAGPDAANRHLIVTFAPGLSRSLDPATAVLHGNVAKATHGETVKEEVLGDGHSATPFLKFRIAKSPVTHVPRAGAPRGAANTLRVRVNGVLWHEVQTLLGAMATEQAFETRLEEGGTTVVQFGNNETGATLPTGRKNVVASYRVGMGKSGNVRAATLSNLLDKPLGLKAAINPLGAHGGADAESTENARRLAPMKVRTFGRVVSLKDFEDAALDYAGVTKARATWKWQDGEQVVALTVGGDPDAPLTDATVADLTADLDERRDPIRKMAVARYVERPILVTVRVEVDPRYDPTMVASSVRAAILDAFAYEQMAFGQPVNMSDVYAAVHRAEGVVAARIMRLRLRDAPAGTPANAVVSRIPMGSTALASIQSLDLVVETTPRLIPEDAA